MQKAERRLQKQVAARSQLNLNSLGMSGLPGSLIFQPHDDYR